jgi:hypothetical protein
MTEPSRKLSTNVALDVAGFSARAEAELVVGITRSRSNPRQNHASTVNRSNVIR